MAELLRLAGVHTHIGQYHILQGVDLVVPEGEVTMLLGRNGAGKTTTMRTIMGLWQASAGENMGIFTELTVQENLILAATAGPIDQGRLDWVFSAFPPLKTFWSLPAGHLSGGQKQMLAVARAVIEPRRLLLIDEPSKGLAPAIVEALVGALKELKEGATTILLVEQNFAMAKALGETVAVMDDGRIVHAGEMAALAADTALQERLMGLSMEAVS
jgi:branched-chain amino acid transport system ATP-binding protein